MSKEQDQAKKWGQLVAKCWQDEAFKARFLADPAAVLKEYGIEGPAGLKVVENSAKEIYFVLPQRPADLTDKDLDGIAGGSWPPWGPPIDDQPM